MRRTVTTWVPRAALAVAGFAIALLVVEAALALRPAPHCGGTPPFWRPDRDVGWALVPGIRRDAAVCRGTETYYEWDAHWDAEGHAVVTEALAPFVETLLRD